MNAVSSSIREDRLDDLLNILLLDATLVGHLLLSTNPLKSHIFGTQSYGETQDLDKHGRIKFKSLIPHTHPPQFTVSMIQT